MRKIPRRNDYLLVRYANAVIIIEKPHRSVVGFLKLDTDIVRAASERKKFGARETLTCAHHFLERRWSMSYTREVFFFDETNLAIELLEVAQEHTFQFLERIMTQGKDEVAIFQKELSRYPITGQPNFSQLIISGKPPIKDFMHALLALHKKE